MSNFSCKDKSVEHFLKNKALEFDKRNVARTYLVIDAVEASKGNFVILAYFTIAFKNLEFDKNLSKNKIKQIDGFSKNAESVGTILIGQLGKNSNFSTSISGDYLLELAISIIYKVFDFIGCRIILLECLPIEKIVSFYTKHGFSFLQKNSEYTQLIKFL